MQDLSVDQSPWEPLGTDLAGVLSTINKHMIETSKSSPPTISSQMASMAYDLIKTYSSLYPTSLVYERNEKLNDIGHHTYFFFLVF